MFSIDEDSAPAWINNSVEQVVLFLYYRDMDCGSGFLMTLCFKSTEGFFFVILQISDCSRDCPKYYLSDYCFFFILVGGVECLSQLVMCKMNE